MKKVVSLAVTALCLAGLAAPAVAQEAGPPQVFFVYSEHVKASMMQEYEAMTKEMIQAMAAAPGVKGSLEWTTIWSPDLGYSFVFVTEGFSGMDKLHQSWQTAIEAMGREKFMKLGEKTGPMIERGESYALILRPDLSYMPETVGLTAAPLRMYHWWYTTPGKEMAVEAVAKEYVELYKAKNIDRGWRVYQAAMGDDLPMYLVVETASKMADYYTESEKIEAALGEEGKKLQQKALKLTRRVEDGYGVVRTDLSFPPAEMKSESD